MSIGTSFQDLALIEAAQTNNVEQLRELIAAGANLDVVDSSRMSALHWAASNGYIDTVNALIAAGADVNAVDNQGRSALHMVAHFGRTDIVKALIAAGANVNAVRGIGMSVLHMVARYGRTDNVNALIAAGADLNAVDSLGMSALHWAARYGRIDTVNALIAAGASVNAIDLRPGGVLSNVLNSILSRSSGGLTSKNEFKVICDIWQIAKKQNINLKESLTDAQFALFDVCKSVRATLFQRLLNIPGLLDEKMSAESSGLPGSSSSGNPPVVTLGVNSKKRGSPTSGDKDPAEPEAIRLRIS